MDGGEGRKISAAHFRIPKWVSSPWVISCSVEAKRAHFSARLKEWQAAGSRIVIYFQTEGEIERFREIMGDPTLAGVELEEGTLARGFIFPQETLWSSPVRSCLGDFRLMGGAVCNAQKTARKSRAQIDFSEWLKAIWSFTSSTASAGSRNSRASRRRVEECRKCSSWNSPMKRNSTFRLSRHTWSRVMSVSAKGLRRSVHWPTPSGPAQRKTPPPRSSTTREKCWLCRRNAKRSPAMPSGATQNGRVEFEHSFPYRETPDQVKAITATKRDMEQARSMDRLICGDVGFGKTEVAIRAAFKAVMEGKQVAMLAPTTVLAQQHFETFRQRMLDYPVRIEMLSRFRSHAEQRQGPETPARRRGRI